MDIWANPLFQLSILLIGFALHFWVRRRLEQRAAQRLKSEPSKATEKTVKTQEAAVAKALPTAPAPLEAKSEQATTTEKAREMVAPSLPPTPAPPRLAQADDAVRNTEAAVAGLPERVVWRPADATADSIPLLFDGSNWHTFNLLGSEHGVICGASRSGKGNLLQLIVLSALHLGPAAAQVWVIDAKNGLDYSFTTKLGHARLYADIAEADGSITAGLDAAIREMTERNTRFFDKARNIHEWNDKHPSEKLPILVVVVDEVAELDKDQHAKLCTLARMGAGAGLVIFAATQYPTVDALPSQIQANMLNRIVLKLASGKQTAVSLALAPGERSLYEPAAIKPRGVAVFRRNGGEESLGRIPEVTDTQRTQVVAELVERNSRKANVSGISDERSPERPALNVQPPMNAEPERSARSTRSDARSSGVQGSAFGVQVPQMPPRPALDGLNVNADELAQLGKALTLRAEGKTKQQAIEAAFNCRKGGSREWQRASQLFDLSQSSAQPNITDAA